MKVNDSERLSFALMGPGDADLLFALDQDVEVMRYINGGKMTTMDEIETVFLPRLAQYSNPDKGWGLWKVTVTHTGEYIGWVLVRPLEFFSDTPQWKNWELGWRFMRSSWGQGFATEAAKQIMQAIIETQDVNKLTAIALPDNESSFNIMKKLGMSYLKTDINKDPLGDLEAVYYELSL